MKRRKQLLISDEVQDSLLLRVTGHWILFLLANYLAIAFWIACIDLPTATRSEQYAMFLRLMIPLTICSIAIVPIFLYDIAKLSNQFAGPIRRIRADLTRYLESGRFNPIKLRQNDFWRALANDLNTAFSRHQTAQPSSTSVAADSVTTSNEKSALQKR